MKQSVVKVGDFMRHLYLVIQQLRKSVNVLDLDEASRRLRRFRSERIDLGVKRPASPGSIPLWFPAHVRVFMASELGANGTTLGRSRTTRENRVTALPPKRIAHYRQTRAPNSHTRSPKIGVARRRGES